MQLHASMHTVWQVLVTHTYLALVFQLVYTSNGWGSSIKDVHAEGGGAFMSKWTYVDRGCLWQRVFKVRWMCTNCTIIITFVTIYSCLTMAFQEMTDVCSSSKMQNAKLLSSDRTFLFFSKHMVVKPIQCFSKKQVNFNVYWLFTLYRVAQNRIPHQTMCSIFATSGQILKILESA